MFQNTQYKEIKKSLKSQGKKIATYKTYSDHIGTIKTIEVQNDGFFTLLDFDLQGKLINKQDYPAF